MTNFEHQRKRPSQEEWAAALGKLKMVSGELKGPCPVCAGTDRFSVRKDGMIHCRGCQPGRTTRTPSGPF